MTKGVNIHTLRGRADILHDWMVNTNGCLTISSEDPRYGISRTRISTTEQLSEWLVSEKLGLLYIIYFEGRRHACN